MLKMWIGFLFIMLDFSFDIEGHTIELLPDFVGFALLALGLGELKAESKRFGAAQPFAWTLAGLTGAYWLADVCGLFIERQWLYLGLGMGLWALSLYVIFEAVRGVRETGERRGCDLNAAALKKVWIVMAVLAAASYAGLFVPVLALALSAASFITGLVFLWQFNKTKKRYEEALREDQPPAWDVPAGQPPQDDGGPDGPDV